MDHFVHIDTKGRIWTLSAYLKETKLIIQGLGDIRQTETPATCIMQISYPCFMFPIHSQHLHKIRNGIRKHLLAFVPFVKQIC